MHLYLVSVCYINLSNMVEIIVSDENSITVAVNEYTLSTKVLKFFRRGSDRP